MGWFLLLIVAFPLHAQRERQAPDQDEYSRKFFEQLRSLFGRFRDADLQRAFELARPIRCSELISGTGEWRNVAFFNEDRNLGNWYHSSLEEVRGDLSSYTFKGPCSTDQSSVQLVTKYPVRDSLDRYASGRIRASDIKVITNPAVRASFDTRTGAYGFELPYLYAIRGRNPRDVTYSLVAPSASERYATNMTNFWDCKSVHGNDLTFQFLICDTQALPRGADPRSRSSRTFGTAAYFILSDGQEASTTIRLSFGDESAPGDDKADRNDQKPAEPVAAVVDAPAGPLASWQIPGAASKLVEVDKSEFRIRFSPQTWAGKIGAAQVLVDQRMSSFDPAKPPVKVDYCVWRPASTTLAARALGSEPDADVGYTLTTTDTSINFDIKTHNGSRVGALQCSFQGAEGASMDRWVGVVGGHLTIEVLP